MMDQPLLEVEDLRVRFHLRTGTVEAVRGVSFQLGRERLGIVGESGSGKSQTGRAILGLTPPSGEVTAKRLAFDGIDLQTASKRTLRQLRGGRISMVMQDPKYSLNPVMTIGDQIIEAYQAHAKASRAEARDKALAMLEAVKMRDPGHVFSLYPHESLAEDMRSKAGPRGEYEGFALAYNARSRSEVDAIFARLGAKGATIVKPPAEAFWGGYSGYFADPDGHRWEVAHNPFWTIGADGRVSLTPS